MSFKILLIDDDPESFEYIESLIKKISDGIELYFVQTYELGLDMLEKNDISLLFVDIGLPETPGDEFIQKIKSNLKNEKLSIIAISDETDEEKIDRAYDAGAIDFIKKPLNAHKLVSEINYYRLLHKNEIELQKERDFVHTVMNTALSPIFIHDGTKITFANKKFFEIIGVADIDELNKKYSEIRKLFKNDDGSDIEIDDCKEWLDSFIENKEKRACINAEDNKKNTYTLAVSYIEDKDLYTIILYDITKELEHEKELSSLLYIENLTKLPNRSKLIDDLQNKEYGISSLSIIDINSFKEINDFYGHRIGDFILKGVADLIQKVIENYSELKLYKFPADTYCVTNSTLGSEEFTNVVKTIVEIIGKKVFYYEQHEIDTRATVGISFSTRSNKLITADLALQAAKKDHKDYLVFYDELDNLQEYENNMLWTKKLKKALLKDNIIVYFQPLINNKTMKVDKYECLVRMIDDDKVISPFFFLDISKKSNQYTKITKIVIEKSFKEFENLPFEFSVNVSYEDIEDDSFLNFIKEKLEIYNVSDRVVFEILEDEGVKNYNVLIDFISEVKSLGCKVAIDDFGSGYSNFEHLLKMNVDFLKIDASLIKNIATDENSFKVTKTVMEFAKSLNLKTIAEFVENEEIFNIVKELGADYSQGYYFSAPIAKPNMYSVSQGSL